MTNRRFLLAGLLLFAAFPAVAGDKVHRLALQISDDSADKMNTVLGNATTKGLVIQNGDLQSLDAAVTGKLADPTLELRDQNGVVVRSDDNWRTGGQESEITQTGLAPTNELESALIETLSANANYTAVVSGVNDVTGIAVVEIYALE